LGFGEQQTVLGGLLETKVVAWRLLIGLIKVRLAQGLTLFHGGNVGHRNVSLLHISWNGIQQEATLTG
jgi:hypothetical protein